jgi:fimbrial protein
MRLSNFIYLTCLAFLVSTPVMAHHQLGTVYGGVVHVRGGLGEGGCYVSSGSESMKIDMGNYRNTMFTTLGSSSPIEVPFTLHITGCNPELVHQISLSFYGQTDPKNPLLFAVQSGKGGPVGISGKNGYSGLGLALSDSENRFIAPGSVFTTSSISESGEMLLHYKARYQKTSRNIYPGALRSEAWFLLNYS